MGLLEPGGRYEFKGSLWRRKIVSQAGMGRNNGCRHFACSDPPSITALPGADIQTAVESGVREGADGLFLTSASMFGVERVRITGLAARHPSPRVIYPLPSHVIDADGLIGVRPFSRTGRLLQSTRELGLAGVRPMARHRIHSLAFKKQVVQEYAAGATLNGLAREHDLSRPISASSDRRPPCIRTDRA